MSNSSQATRRASVTEGSILNTDNIVEVSIDLSLAVSQRLEQDSPSTTKRVFCICLSIARNVLDYTKRRITSKRFLVEIVGHVYNLCQILKVDVLKIKDTILDFFRRHLGANAPPQSTNDVVAIIDNAVTSRNDTNEELPEVEDNVPSSSSENRKHKYEIILDEVTQRVYRMHSQRVHSTPTAEQVTDILQTFTKDLSSMIRDITSRTQRHYDDILRLNSSLLGEERAKDALSKIGIHSKSDFADAAFEQIMDVVKTRNEILTYSTAEVHVDKVTALIRGIFSIHAGKSDRTEITVPETCDLFEKIVSLVLEPLIEDYTKSMEMYRTYAVLGGDRAVRMILEVFNLKKDDIECCREDDVTILNIALKKINRFEVISQLSVGSIATNSGSSENEGFSHEM